MVIKMDLLKERLNIVKSICYDNNIYIQEVYVHCTDVTASIKEAEKAINEVGMKEFFNVEYSANGDIVLTRRRSHIDEIVARISEAL